MSSHRPRWGAKAQPRIWGICSLSHGGTHRAWLTLPDAEARSVGWWCMRASRALRDVARAEHVYAAVIGDGVPHLHVHLLPRFAGTPREYWGIDVDEWPQARRGTAAEIVALGHELRGYLADTTNDNQAG
jgi:diadenosine tetraphosphate (Ap4A) HIT family hydrolase